MTPKTLYNCYWDAILAKNLVFDEMEKMLFVTHAEYATSEFNFGK